MLIFFDRKSNTGFMHGILSHVLTKRTKIETTLEGTYYESIIQECGFLINYVVSSRLQVSFLSAPF